MSEHPTIADPARTRALATMGIAGAALAVVLISALHLVTAGEVDPIQLTISQYALGPYDWMFDVGIIGLALGSALVVAALVRAEIIRLRSASTVLLGAWIVGLVAVVAFERTNWSLGATFSGSVHRYASVVAFLSLPLAAFATARWGRVHPTWHRIAAWTRGLGIASLLWFALILGGIAVAPSTGISWWDLIPLGLIERGLALTEVAALVAMGIWAHRAASRSDEAVAMSQAAGRGRLDPL